MINKIYFKKSLFALVIGVMSLTYVVTSINAQSGSSDKNQSTSIEMPDVTFENLKKEDFLAKGWAQKKDDGSIELNKQIELGDKRSQNSKTWLTGYNKDGQAVYKGRFYGGAIHYFDKEKNRFEDVDTSLVEEGDKYKMNKSNYHAQIKKNLSDKFITFSNQDQELYFSLPAYPENNVSAEKTQDSKWANKQAKFKNALAQGVDIDVNLDVEKLIKEVVINNLESLGDLTDKEYYEATFKLSSNRNIDIKVGNKLLSKEGAITTGEMAEVVDDQGVTSYIWPPKAEDSSGNLEGTIGIEIKYELRDDGIYLTKILPVDWLKSAVYPVRADATVSYYSGSGDGLIASSPYQTSWSTQHAATTGRDAIYTDTSLYSILEVFAFSTGYLAIDRIFFSMDTSAIPDNANISSTTFNGYVTNVADTANDAYSYISLVEGLQSSSTILINDDFDQCGDAITNPTKGATDKDITSVADDSYLEIDLNETGLGWVSKTGFTKLGIREGHDVENNTTTISGWSGTWRYSGVWFSSSETTGTSQDPYLEITYSLSYVPTSLKVEGQTNPTKITDTFPEFYATYEDDDTGDNAIYYQIQVATSSSYWGDPIWDSSKTAMATTTEGSICPSATYGDSDGLAFDGSTYHWRMRFWDDEDLEGDWSDGSDYFIMADSVRLQFP